MLKAILGYRASLRLASYLSETILKVKRGCQAYLGGTVLASEAQALDPTPGLKGNRNKTLVHLHELSWQLSSQRSTTSGCWVQKGMGSWGLRGQSLRCKDGTGLERWGVGGDGYKPSSAC